jgi:hypothetical protein
MKAFFRSLFLVTVLYPSIAATGPKPTAEQIDFFEKKVRPILVNHCYTCHSADT